MSSITQLSLSLTRQSTKLNCSLSADVMKVRTYLYTKCHRLFNSGEDLTSRYDIFWTAEAFLINGEGKIDDGSDAYTSQRLTRQNRLIRNLQDVRVATRTAICHACDRFKLQRKADLVRC